MKCPYCMVEFEGTSYYARECPRCHYTTRFKSEMLILEGIQKLLAKIDDTHLDFFNIKAFSPK